MKTQISNFDIIRIEENHTKWLRNAKTFELSSPYAKHAYAVTQGDGEYGHDIHRNIFFDIDTAFSFACNFANRYEGRQYSDFILITSTGEELHTDIDAMYDWDDSDFHWEHTKINIMWYTKEGKQEQAILFGKQTFK